MSAHQTGPESEGRHVMTQKRSTISRLLSRRVVVLVALTGSALLMLSTTMTWVSASGLGETAAVEEIEITGSEVAETVSAMGLVGLAGAIAVTMAARLGRWIIAVLLLLASTMTLYTAVGALVDPVGAAETVVGETTGTTSTAQSYSLGLGAWVASLGGVLMLVASVTIASVSHQWGGRRASKKYDRDASGSTVEPDEYDLWDGLSEGEDPTHSQP